MHHIRTRLAVGLVVATLSAQSAQAMILSDGGQAPAPRPIVTENASGFDWDAAGVGFATAAGLLLLSGGSTVAIRRRRTHDSMAH